MPDNITAPLSGPAVDATAALRFVEKSSLKTAPVIVDAGGAGAEDLSSFPTAVGRALPIATANVPGAVSSVTSGAPVTVLAAFATRRRGMLIPTDGDVYMSLTGTADATSGILPAGTPFNLDGFSGSVSMLGVSGTVVVSKWEF
jgi:hypothetical protein